MGAQRTIIRPHPRDNQLSPIPVDFDPETLGWILDEGGRGNLMLQNELFNTMEDTWERLRGNLNKLKKAVCKLPFNLQPWTEKGREPSASALEKAAFVEHVLHNQKAATWEGQHNFHGTIYELLDAVARGVAVLEIDWTVEDGKYIPTGTRRVPWTCLGFEQPTHHYTTQRLNPSALRLFPDRDPNLSKAFAAYPHKFLVGVYRAKSGHIAETAQLRSLAHLWLGRMLGWEWMAHKAELFGIPLRWATYDPAAPQTQIDQISDMLRNMGTAAWGAFPQGTDLQILNGNTPGVAGSSEPTERLMYLADRACDLLFLGQTLTSEEGNRSGSYALGNVHREVELDLYENYAAYVIDVINNQLIPSIIELNWGNSEELPFLEVELNRPEKDKQIVERDKTLFVDMALPVSKQWLYDRHKVPAPGPSEDLFSPTPNPNPPGGTTSPRPELAEGVSSAKSASSESASKSSSALSAHSAVNHSCVHAASESTAALNARRLAAYIDFFELLSQTDLSTHDLVWTSGDCPVCAPLNGTTFPDGWTAPPPLHHNCDCVIRIQETSKRRVDKD
jgi:phage gp29-like protein